MYGRLNGNNGLHLSHLAKLVSVADRSVLHEEAFRRMLSLERKRAQRSGKPFLLALLEMDSPLTSEKKRKTLAEILSVLATTTRETDVTGWYQDGCMVGVMLTEIGMEDRSSLLATITTRLRGTLRSHLNSQQFSQLVISFQVFPEERDDKMLPTPSGPPLYSEGTAGDEARRLG